MSGAAAEIVAGIALVVVLIVAVARPRDLPEAIAAVPAAAILLALGIVSIRTVLDVLGQLGDVVGFLACVLVLAKLCDTEGLFRWAGAVMAGRSHGRPVALLVAVFVVASLVTAVLSLDATVVLLTPVVIATATRAGVRARPHLYACAHLSNSASLVLPVSNLTNLIAVSVAGIGFLHFAGLMAAPWVVAVVVEFAVFRLFFARDLRPPAAGTESPAPTDEPAPRVALVVLGLTLAGFVACSVLGASPVWAALGGAVVLAARGLVRRSASPLAVVKAADVPFLAFVLALGVVVRGFVDHGFGGFVAHLVPQGTSWLELLAVAALAALLANVINNLPAVLVLLPIVVPHGIGPVLAVLLGVNIGPNLAYPGSLATMLWRRVIKARGQRSSLGEFSALAVATVPVTLLAAVTALWVGLRISA